MNIYKKIEDKLTMRQYNKVKEWEYNTFEPESRQGKESLSIIRNSIRTMIFSFLLTIFFIYMPNSVGFFTAWVFFMSWLVKGQTEGKMFSGYPYPEHTTAIGTMFIGIPSLIIAVILIIVFL
jgi:exopolysaccharide biosynthesis predicted pyruvyltransferase EpsI